ncbi:MAG: hypothetical protein LBD60_02795, partial [Puniceicoccales bacterium]|nr:hypothetical protein [Puniceicoccales bacterium]
RTPARLAAIEPTPSAGISAGSARTDVSRVSGIAVDRVGRASGIQLTDSDAGTGYRPSNYHWKCFIDVPNNAP